VKFNDLEDLQRKFDTSVCAVCIETIQGEGGICPVNREFLELASRLTKRSGALLLIDEIQCVSAHRAPLRLPALWRAARCGHGRQTAGVRIAARRHPDHGTRGELHASRYARNNVRRRPAVLRRAIEFLREEKKLLKHVRKLGEYFHAALEVLDKKHKSIQDVRGAGLMLAVELDSPELAKL